jgi:hypothetical protein
VVVVGLEGLGRVERLEEGLWEALGLARCVRRKRRLVGLRAGLLRGLRPRSGGHLRQGVVEDRPRGLLRSPHRVGGRVWGSVAS